MSSILVYYPAKLFTMEVKRNFWEEIKCKDAQIPPTPGLNFEAKNIKFAWIRRILPLVNSSFLLVDLLGSLGRLALHNLGGGGLDDAHSDGLPHVTDSEPDHGDRKAKSNDGEPTHLPRGGKSVKGSTHMGLLGVSFTMAASPDLMNLGLSSTDLPVRRSTFSLISAN